MIDFKKYVPSFEKMESACREVALHVKKGKTLSIEDLITMINCEIREEMMKVAAKYADRDNIIKIKPEDFYIKIVVPCLIEEIKEIEEILLNTGKK